jgi:hypothetical protein
MDENTKIISKELRKRVKNAVMDILELVEKEGKTSVKYEELPWINPKEMRISIFACLIRYSTIKGILKIIKQHGLKVTSIIFERWRGDVVMEIKVTLKDGEKYVE